MLLRRALETFEILIMIPCLVLCIPFIVVCVIIYKRWELKEETEWR